MSDRHDLILAGGGLANGLIAFRLTERRPDLRFLVIEGGETLGGNHTWSFHDGDLSPSEHAWMEPFVAHRWPGYEVRFPRRSRPVATGYASVSSERFRALLTERLGDRLMLGAPIASLDPGRVTLQDGRSFGARAVIDGRGHRGSRHLKLGFQKFLGQEWELAEPHGLAHPIVMDATVPQRDGYRFVYVLPFSPTRLLIEDTYYADDAALDTPTLRTSIADYAGAQGWRLQALVREEHGILPIALDGRIEDLVAEAAGVPTVGLARALFHPTTGYSLPDAVHVADLVAALPDLSSASLARLLAAHARNLWQDRAYFRLLNRLLFLAGVPEERYRILEHFYRLPDPLVARFYAARLDMGDKIRIFAGKPPVSIRSAIRVLAARRTMKDDA
ncbi:lycopene beta-cyclase CrtY [Aureimonas sp. AU12]|uniref:lycopene beta-cyclase CrtY n=1 Tax=Aureimonas sp. AU12 TaxID=1638161 RepID=UPI000783BB1F|nr:lycopene beta-cyclase CrtY [Aureimonas sp. AU12]